MEAVVFDAKTLTLKYQKDYPIPTIKNDDDVIVKVHYSGICGTDVHIIQGNINVLKERPLPLGHEPCGVVHAVGKTAGFKIGQKVVIDPNSPCYMCDHCRKGKYQYCMVSVVTNTIGIFKDGGWAQYVLAPKYQVFALPDGISTEQGGLCEPYSCVSHGFDRAAPLKVGETILILGAGIIGNLWATTLHHHGHREVTVSEPIQARREIVKKLNTGFRLTSPDVLAKENALFDVIIDCTGVGKVMEASFNMMNPGGKYVLFGCCPEHHTATINPFEIYKKELTVIGIKINPYSFPSAIGLVSAMGDRYLNYENLGVKTYKLSEYEQAMKDLKAGVVSKGMFKVI